MKFLSNYLDFIFEAITKKEMRLYYSDDFKNMLRGINNSISQALLASEDTNQMVDIYTLVDITDKNDTISLIQVSRLFRGDQENFTQIGGESRLPYNIRNKKSGSEFWTKGRTEMKIGRWVKRIFTEVHKSTISDSEIENFVNLYKSKIDGEDLTNFELVKGEDIRKWYHENNYLERRGQLGNSCMRYHKCQEYLDIYVKNPEVCQLLILKSDDGNKIKGRALIWKLTNGEYYMDRTYTINDSDRLLFQDYARINKIKNSYDTGLSSSEDLIVELGDHTYEKYPYMDTFVVYNPSTKILRDDEELWPGQGYVHLQHTDGSFEPEDAVYSNWDDEYIRREDAVYCSNVDDWLRRSSARYLKYKDVWAAPNDNITYSEYHGEYFYEEDVVYSEAMGDVLYPENEDVIEIIINSNGDTDWCIKSRDDLYIKVSGKYYLRKECIKDPFTGEYKFKDDKEYQKSLDLKLMKEFGIEITDETYRYDNPTRKSIETVKEELKLKLIDLKITDKIKESITENDKYKNILNKYKDYRESVLPTVDDIFILLKLFISDPTDYSNLTYGNIKIIYEKFLFFGGEEDKFNEFRNLGILKDLIKICITFDYSVFPNDIYKRYVFLLF